MNAGTPGGLRNPFWGSSTEKLMSSVQTETTPFTPPGTLASASKENGGRQVAAFFFVPMGPSFASANLGTFRSARKFFLFEDERGAMNRRKLGSPENPGVAR